MRSRNIKPQFWKNEELANCSFEARLLFIGLWGIADWKGRLECRPKRIKAEVFPYDNVDVDSCLEELQGQGLINLYNSRKHIHIPSFETHQHCHKNEKSVPSTFPEPSNNGTQTDLEPSENDTTPASYCLPLTESFLPHTDTPSTDGALKEKPEKNESSSSKATLSSKKQTVIKIYNSVAERRGWRKCSKIPAGEVGRTLEARVKDDEWMETFPEAMELAEGLDWMEKGKLETFIRADATRKILDGEWAPRSEAKPSSSDDGEIDVDALTPEARHCYYKLNPHKRPADYVTPNGLG